MIDVYTRSGTFSGFEQSMAGWTLRTSGQGAFTAANTPSPIVLNSPIALGPTTTGVAVVAVNFQHDYTNGTGANQNYTDGTLSMAAGSSNSTPFSTPPFTPRGANMAFHYGCP